MARDLRRDAAARRGCARPVMARTEPALRTLRFGHSPDADDAFMFFGFHAGQAEVPGCRVEHVLEDIQSLNRRACERADLEITAVSAHAYAQLSDRYAILSCGASMGLGYGPLVVAREPLAPEKLRGRRIAIPGALTTAALLLQIECPESLPVEVRFDHIPDAVAAGEFDAGVVIHESQLTFADQGLTRVLDLGERWREREHLPVPLGLDVVRRDLGPALMRAVSDGFRASIQAALDHEDEAIRYALPFSRGLDEPTARRFVRMYVNELTLEMGERGRRALEHLYRRAITAGAIQGMPALDVV